MGWKEKTIYADPVGGDKRFEGMPRPDVILVTDIHGDHLNTETLEAVAGAQLLNSVSQPQLSGPGAAGSVGSPEVFGSGGLEGSPLLPLQ